MSFERTLLPMNAPGAPASLPARSPRQPDAGRDAGAPSSSASCRSAVRAAILLALLVGGLALPASGQWVTQNISLRPGWNAIYLEVEPEPSSCAAVFTNIPIESVWGWNRDFSAVEFVQDADQLLAPRPDWLTYLPPSSPVASESTLFHLEGGKTYLVKTPTNGVPRTLTLLGTPTLRRTHWLANSYNLAGVPVNTAAPPTFQSFFQPSPAHAGSQIYRLGANGHWASVSASTTTMQAGEAFWIFCAGESDYAGPIQISLDQSTGLDYSRALAEQTLRLKNLGAAPKNLIVKLLPSLPPPPTGDVPLLAGPVALSYWKMNFTSNQFWLPLPAQLASPSIPAVQEWALRLQVRRQDMAPFLGSGPQGALYESVLEITDTAGSLRYRIPVTAQGRQTRGSQFGMPGLAKRAVRGRDAGSVHPLAGLWVGSATINKVSQPAADPATPLPTASDFQLRLLFHVNASGEARLLQRVFQLWKPGTYKPDPSDPDNQIVDEPGRFVLISEDRFLKQFSGSTIGDGALVGRRYSSAAFGFDNSITNLSNGEFGTNLWSCRVVVGYDDPTNPFKHLYHPDHDNLDENSPPGPLPVSTNAGWPGNQSVAGPSTSESFTVTRYLNFQFTPTDPEGLALAGWGDNQIGGNYSETITGIHRSPINVSGTFRLRHASTVAVLNDGLTTP